MSSDRKGSAKSKILVADDLADNRLYLSAVLEEQGYEVRFLSFEQVSLVQQEAGLSDLILLNINAENERSHAIWQELKDACLTAQISVILLDPSERILQKLLADATVGVDYIRKPFRAAELLTRNDTYGHLAGDGCLQQVAKAIAAVVKRPADLAARYGGEEFAVILPNTNLFGATHIAKQIRRAVKGLEICHDTSQVGQHVTLSLGVTSLIPTADAEPTVLVDAADCALYQAKQKGRDRLYAIWTKETQTNVSSTLENGLRQCFEPFVIEISILLQFSLLFLE